MEIYDVLMAPLENRWLAKHRGLLMAHAAGNVLEVGFGTGVNLKHYDPLKVKSLTALDVDSHKAIGDTAGFNITYVTGQAEALPFDDESFDTVVETLVFCSVSNLEASISEVLRVLKPGGKFIYMDHVLPEHSLLAGIFKGLNLVWPHIACGCNLTREPHRLIEQCRLDSKESGAFANGVFRYGVVEKPSGGL